MSKMSYKSPCDGCDTDHKNLTLISGRGLCESCLGLWREAQESMLDEVMTLIDNLSFNRKGNTGAVETLKTLHIMLKQKYGEKDA